jgi:uncharacterized oxidoreductase
MKTYGNTILITGGATGIGFGLAEAFVKGGNKVLICGRRKAKLEEAKGKLSQIQVRQCDLTLKEERQSLFNWVKDNHGDLNILVNNAGIAWSHDFKKGASELTGYELEIQTNLVAPIHLSACFIPLLIEKKEAAIINISSGGAFIPIVGVPIYCATKAALHSFSLSLRYQLKDTGVKVFEIVPPIVETELGEGTTDASIRGHKGILPSELAAAAIQAFKKNEFEIAIGMAKGFVEGSKKDFEKTFQDLNNH